MFLEASWLKMLQDEELLLVASWLKVRQDEEILCVASWLGVLRGELLGHLPPLQYEAMKQLISKMHAV